MALHLTKRTTAVCAAAAVAVLGTVGIVSATGGDAKSNAAKSSTSRPANSTSTAAEHDMDSHGGDSDSTGTTHGDGHGGHDDATGTTHGDGHGGHDDSTGTTHGDNHDDSTGTTHGDDHGGHTDTTVSGNGSTGTTHSDDHGGHTDTTVSGSGGTTTTHGGHNHGPTTTVTGSGGTTTTHNHQGTSTTHNHGPTTTGAGGTTTTHGGHGGPVVQYDDLPADLQAQVDLGTQVALRYPTTADASAAGWGESTVFFPGIAAHYLQGGWLDSTFDPAKPEVLLYGRNGEIVGHNYIVYNGATPPEGFAGNYDSWHEHPALCRSLTTGLIIGGEDLSQAECAAIGGVSFSFAGFYLLHVWTVPGYTSPEGVFSHENTLVQ